MDATLFDPPDPLARAYPVDEVDTAVPDAVAPVELDPHRLLPSDVPEALREIDSLRSLRSTAEAREFVVAAHLASIAPHPARTTVTDAEQLVDLGGDGCPAVPESIALQLAALLRVPPTSARALIADALSVRHRHPRLWRAVREGLVPVWQARRIAQAVRWAGLDLAGALRVDRYTAPALGRVSWRRLESLVEGEIVAADPERAAEAEERARKGASAHIARGEQAVAGVRTLTARLRITDALSIESIIGKVAAVLAQPYEVSPWDTRRARHADLDHADPYRRTGVGDGERTPGQTRPDNLGPIGRAAHRAQTHAGWWCRQVRAGRWWLWRTPYSTNYQVDNWGASRWPSPTSARRYRRPWP